MPASAIKDIEDSLEGLPDDRRAVERRKRLHEWIDAGHGACLLRGPEIASMVQDTFLHFDGDRYRLHAWVVMPNHFHVLFEPLDDWPLGKIVASWKKFTARKIKDYLRNANQEPERNANREIGGPRGENANREIGGPGRENANREIGGPGGENANRRLAGPGSANLPIGIDQPIWQREYWDRYIRNASHYENTVEYIHYNPVAAGLTGQPEDWPWSSAEAPRT